MISTAGFAFPKPGHAAGRVILSGKRYSAHKRQCWELQAHCCARCRRYLADPRAGDLHHRHGRGMGGGKRDDRLTELLCRDCHDGAKIERRENWLEPAGLVSPDVESAAPSALRIVPWTSIDLPF